VLLGVGNWFDGPLIERIRRIFAHLICVNPSDRSNPWSINPATQIQDTTKGDAVPLRRAGRVPPFFVALESV
jgi:hypothetical protein